MPDCIHFGKLELQISFLKGVICSYDVLRFYCVLITQLLE
jgi:hypothetical protein